MLDIQHLDATHIACSAGMCALDYGTRYVLARKSPRGMKSLRRLLSINVEASVQR